MSYEALNEKLLKGKKEDKFFVAVVPVTEIGEVLIGKRTEDGIWTTPGGGGEPGEEPHEAARRELFEEAGLAAPPNTLELVNVGETPRGHKIYSFLWRMPKILGDIATSKLDPDKEVKSWKLLRPEDFPAAMSEKKNASRLKTIREALMRLYAVKSNEDSVMSLVEKLNKGGEGSGVVGHVTARKPSELHPSLNGKPLAPETKLQIHLKALKHGGVMPGMNTESGKPVANDMKTARAHGYDVQDHVDAMNAHYELAQRTQKILDKLKTAGHKVPEEGEKIVQFHNMKMREHMNARTFLEERKKRTEAKVKENEQKRKEHMGKSVTQMGSGLGDRDLDIGSFAQAAANGSAEWMEKLYSAMEGFNYGDDPRTFLCDKGMLHLAKVDDGIYTGYFTKNEDGLLDNAKVRIERMTIPELVQFMVAKEWIANPVVAPPVDTVAEIGKNYAAQMDVVAAGIEEQERQSQVMALAEALKNPQDVPPGGHLDQKIKLLELVNKLIS